MLLEEEFRQGCRQFVAGDRVEMRPAGTDEVTTEEQQIGDFMFDPFQHMSTTIYLPSLSNHGPGQTIPVDPMELKELLRTRYTKPADIVSLWFKQWLTAP
jgi:hypothetical protein